MTFDRTPPYDVAAEEAVIASLMVDADVAALVAPIVSARDFYREQNAWCFEACMALWERGESVNQVTVAHELERRGRLDDAGGLSYLSDLINDLPTPVGVEHTAAIVKRDAMYRQMIGAAVNIAAVAYEAGPDLAAALARAEAEVYGLRAEQRAETDFEHLSVLLDRFNAPAARQETDARPPAARYNLRTGLSELDAVLGGLKGGQLVVIGARTSQGKTALANCLTRNAAVTQHARVAVFSLEMTGRELALRFVASDARVSSKRIAEQETTEAEDLRIGHALIVLASADIYIDSTPSIRPADVRRKCLKLAKEQGLDLIVIDYLQIMAPDKRTGNLNTDTASITQTLKKLAMEFDVAVVLLSQLNRTNPGQIPVLSDLRDSGSIEQDADVVLFIHRQETYTRRDIWERAHAADEPFPAGQALLLVAKQRNGPAPVTLLVKYKAPFTKFEDFDLPATEPVQGAIPDFMLTAAAGYHA